MSNTPTISVIPDPKIPDIEGKIPTKVGDGFKADTDEIAKVLTAEEKKKTQYLVIKGPREQAKQQAQVDFNKAKADALKLLDAPKAALTAAENAEKQSKDPFLPAEINLKVQAAVVAYTNELIKLGPHVGHSTHEKEMAFGRMVAYQKLRATLAEDMVSTILPQVLEIDQAKMTAKAAELQAQATYDTALKTAGATKIKAEIDADVQYWEALKKLMVPGASS